MESVGENQEKTKCMGVTVKGNVFRVWFRGSYLYFLVQNTFFVVLVRDVMDPAGITGAEKKTAEEARRLLLAASEELPATATGENSAEAPVAVSASASADAQVVAAAAANSAEAHVAVSASVNLVELLEGDNFEVIGE